MEFDSDISKLEIIVTRLLSEYDVLKMKCEQLTVDLAESVAQVEELKKQNINLLTEKDSVHSQVSDILGKLTEWEDQVDDKGNGDQVAPPSDSGGQLFSMGDSSS